MTNDERRLLKQAIDARARKRAENNWMNLDPEHLSIRALECDATGDHTGARVLRVYRDEVVNPLLARGVTLSQIEEAAIKHFSK